MEEICITEKYFKKYFQMKEMPQRYILGNISKWRKYCRDILKETFQDRRRKVTKNISKCRKCHKERF